MKKPLVACLAFALTVGVVAAWIIVTRPAHVPTSPAKAEVVEAAPKTWRDRVIDADSNRTPAERADAEFNQLAKPEERIELLEWASEQPWADHKTPVLRKALVADTSDAVQLKALEKSIMLAENAGQAAINEVIRTGLSAGNPRVAQQSLREARKHPSAELVPDLIEIADSKAAHRFLAVDALAFTDDDRARAKIVEVASDSGGDRNLRIRAIALLCKIKGESALQLLGSLVGDTDEEVRKVAIEALAARPAN